MLPPRNALNPTEDPKQDCVQNFLPENKVPSAELFSAATTQTEILNLLHGMEHVGLVHPSRTARKLQISQRLLELEIGTIYKEAWRTSQKIIKSLRIVKKNGDC